MAFTAGSPQKEQTTRSPRRRVVLNATIETLAGVQTVALRNISCTGAMIEAEGVPKAGREVVLKVANFDCFGWVVWSDGRCCGLCFDEPLTSAQVLELHRVTPEAVRSAELQAAALWFHSQGRHAQI